MLEFSRRVWSLLYSAEPDGFRAVCLVLGHLGWSKLENRSAEAMRAPNQYWHIYRPEQIKPELRGGLILILEMPGVTGSPVLRHLFEMRQAGDGGREVSGPPLARGTNRIVFAGVTEAAVCDLMMSDPPIRRDDVGYASYNRQVVRNARQFLLKEPEHGFALLPATIARLLSGRPPERAVAEKA